MGPASSPLGAGQALRTRELKISLDEHIHAPNSRPNGYRLYRYYFWRRRGSPFVEGWDST